jgi:hypothetical protein
MAIINNTYFSGEIYLTHAKPSISDGVKDVENKINSFIEDYEYDCLVNSLGSPLYWEFLSKLDSTQSNGLIVGADVKWDRLLNGYTYTDVKSIEKVWRGIRFKSSPTSDYNRSFLAQYVYFNYESSEDSARTGAGNVQVAAANAQRVAKTQKVTKAWRKFVAMVQGDLKVNPYISKNVFGSFNLTGVDYLSTVSTEVNLYEFINDTNDLVTDTYAKFSPKVWGTMTQLI